jgi:hypothetical protein
MANATLKLKSWVGATFAGWFIGAGLIILFSGFLDGLGIEGYQFYLGLGMGLGVGFMQGLILRGTSVGIFRWTISAGLGLGVPFLLMDILKSQLGLEGGTWFIIISILVSSLISSIWQYRLLHGYENAWRWIPANTIAWLLAVAIVFSMDYTKEIITNNLVGFVVNLSLILGGGVVLGLISGRTLTRMLCPGNAISQ